MYAHSLRIKIPQMKNTVVRCHLNYPIKHIVSKQRLLFLHTKNLLKMCILYFFGGDEGKVSMLFTKNETLHNTQLRDKLLVFTKL